MTQDSISTYGDMWILKDAMEKAKSADPKKVAEAIRTMKRPTRRALLPGRAAQVRAERPPRRGRARHPAVAERRAEADVPDVARDFAGGVAEALRERCTRTAGGPARRCLRAACGPTAGCGAGPSLAAAPYLAEHLSTRPGDYGPPVNAQPPPLAEPPCGAAFVGYHGHRGARRDLCSCSKNKQLRLHPPLQAPTRERGVPVGDDRSQV